MGGVLLEVVVSVVVMNTVDSRVCVAGLRSAYSE
jgi:hypothetical protein